MQLACIMAERLAIQNCERCDAGEACQLECFPGLCVQRRLAQEGFGEIRRACAGSLPSSWSSLSNLTMLSLASNSLTGALTWRNITSPCVLQISGTPSSAKSHYQLCRYVARRFMPRRCRWTARPVVQHDSPAGARSASEPARRYAGR